jgi:hypothetical protein
MAGDPRKRQKKLERRAAKRKERRHELIRQKNRGLSELLALASGAPILHCRIADTLWDQGMGNVLISRQLPKDRVAIGMFLVDSYCLGVKDCYGRLMVRAAYDAMCRQLDANATMEDHAPADTRKLVEDAVEYARQLGFEPHPDYHRVKPIFGDIDPRESTEEFEFGSNGKPLFISGPNDTPERCRQILSTLQHRCGPDGFHYSMVVAASGSMPFRIMEEDAETDDDDDDGGDDDEEDNFDAVPPRRIPEWS